MKFKKIFTCLIIVLITACAHADKYGNNKECNCEGGLIEGTDTAVVKVELDKEGNPKVDTEVFVVYEGQRVVWVGPKEMVIRFPEGSPFKKEKLYTKDAVINKIIPKQRSKEFKKRGEIKFKYDVIVGKKVLDPFMIIKTR